MTAPYFYTKRAVISIGMGSAAVTLSLSMAGMAGPVLQGIAMVVLLASMATWVIYGGVR
jgi:hypothetical protein